VLNLERDAFDAWLLDDPMFDARRGEEPALLTNGEKQQLWDLFGLVKRVAAQSADGSVSSEEIHEINSLVRDLFRYELQAAPALVSAAPALESGAGPGPWTVRALIWHVKGESGNFIASEVITTLLDALEMIAGQSQKQLKCCPAPLHPTAADGMGTCNRFFLDRRRGGRKISCSARCRKQLSRWRAQHGKDQKAFPPRRPPE